MAEILAVKGLQENTTPEFRQKLVKIARRQNLNPSYLAAVISFETASTFSPSIKNPISSATGLIQFLDNTANQLGTNTDALSKMSAEKQLDYVEAYYKKIKAWKGPINTLSDHYLAVIAPAFVGRTSTAVVYERPSPNYEANKKLDRDGSGTITVTEVTTPVSNIVAAAEDKPRIQVDESVSSELSGSAAVILFGLTIWALTGCIQRAKRL